MDKRTYWVLKSIASGRRTEYPKSSDVEEELSILLNTYHIRYKCADDELQEFYNPTNKTRKYEVTALGRAALEDRRSRMFNTWFTRALSITAIIISVIALLGELGILKLQ